MSRFAKRLLVLGAALVVAGLLLAWSGLISVRASSGHWPITEWFLHYVMQQSVATDAIALDVPPLDDPALVRRGAGHFELGCSFCHGSPAFPRTAAALNMLPVPPVLSHKIEEWTPAELFAIVKHGVKFTGMPAWPAQTRDDEVWAVVAFLLELPGMKRQRYLSLAYGDESAGHDDPAPPVFNAPPTPSLSVCRRCHGKDGLGDPTHAFPRLDIQSAAYLKSALRSYVTGTRPSGIMETATTGLSESEMDKLAAYYARQQGQPVRTIDGEVSSAVLDRGRLIAAEGIPERKIAACDGCHGPTARESYPRLSGQYFSYLKLQLELFAKAKERRGGGRFATLMESFSHNLKPSDIVAVSAWYATQDTEAEDPT